MKVFQLMDSDNESMGLIKTNLYESTVTREWKDFYLSSEDCGADTFCEYLNKRHPHGKSERFFVDAEIYL